MSSTSNGVAHRSPLSEVPVDPTSAGFKPPNKQLYNAEADPTAWMYAESDHKLHNDRSPNLGIIHEKPEHRAIVYMKAQGLSNNEVAERTGYTAPWVSQICRQPWFRLHLIAELRNAGVNAVRKVIEASALDSVWTLVELRDDASAPKAVRKSAADSLLDRYLGKAPQRLEVDDRRGAPNTTEIKELDNEIKRLEGILDQQSAAATGQLTGPQT